MSLHVAFLHLLMIEGGGLFGRGWWTYSTVVAVAVVVAVVCVALFRWSLCLGEGNVEEYVGRVCLDSLRPDFWEGPGWWV